MLDQRIHRLMVGTLGMLVAAAAVLAAAPRIALAQLQFGTRLTYPTGTSPHGLALGDVNEDGIADLVTANTLANTVSVLIGNSDGSFQPKVDYPVDAAPVKIVLADVNGDGHLDIVTADQTAGGVTVLLGNGTGGFGTGSFLATGAGAYAVFVGDFNRDGRPDLAVANQSANTISVLVGTGGGAFGTKTDYGTQQAPSSVIAADFNGDGYLDLATANVTDNSITLWRGNGNGTFGNRSDLPGVYGPYMVLAADVNGDGKLDSDITLQVGASRTLRGFGTLGGSPGQLLGGLETIKDPSGGYALVCGQTVNTSRSNSKDNGIITHSWTTLPDSIIGFESRVQDEHDKIAIDIPDLGTPGIIADYPEGSVITVDGTAYPCDELENGPEVGARRRPAPGAHPASPMTTGPDGVTSLEVTNSGINGFVLTGITTEPLSPTSSVPAAGSKGAPGTLQASAWPNPSSGDVRLTFTIPAAGLLRADVFDAGGRVVRRLPECALVAGQQVLAWDGRNDAGRRVPQGIYFVRGRLAQAGRTETASNRLVILR